VQSDDPRDHIKDLGVQGQFGSGLIMKTKDEITALVRRVWATGGGLMGDDAQIIQALPNPKALPFLDVCLEYIGRREAYNKAGRPAFGRFHEWWYSYDPSSANC